MCINGSCDGAIFKPVIAVTLSEGHMHDIYSRT